MLVSARPSNDRPFPPRLQFSAAPVGARQQIDAYLKMPGLPKQPLQVDVTITENDGYRFTGRTEGSTWGGGKFSASVEMAQIGADLVQYDWVGSLRPFGVNFPIPFAMKDTYRILDSRDNYLLLQPVDRPTDTPTLFSYVDGKEVSSVGRKFGIRVDTVNR